jgi:chromosome segregation ATPase
MASNDNVAAMQRAEEAARARLREADEEKLVMQSQLTSMQVESAQRQSGLTAGLDAAAARTEAENVALREQLEKLKLQLTENSRLYQRKIQAGAESEEATRQLREEIAGLEIESHRQKHAIEKQTEINAATEAQLAELKATSSTLRSTIASNTEGLVKLQARYLDLAKDVKTMEVNLEYEKMACKKAEEEVVRQQAKLDEQNHVLWERKQSYEEHSRKLEGLQDQRSVLEARERQAEFGTAAAAASVAGASGGGAVAATATTAPAVVGRPSPSKNPFTNMVAASGGSVDPFGVAEELPPNVFESPAGPFSSPDAKGNPFIQAAGATARWQSSHACDCAASAVPCTL